MPEIVLFLAGLFVTSLTLLAVWNIAQASEADERAAARTRRSRRNTVPNESPTEDRKNDAALSVAAHN